MLWIALLFWSFSAIPLGASDESNPILTGTVNIVLANANGIVALTDSNQTYMVGSEPFTHSKPGQKLFRIDDRTVCTIAGFGAQSLHDSPKSTVALRASWTLTSRN